MSFPVEEKLGFKLHMEPFRDTISTVPIKKRRLFFSRSPSPPPERPMPPTIDYDKTQNKSSCLLHGSSLEPGDLPTSLTALSEKGSSIESRYKILANVDINKPPQCENLIEIECIGLGKVENGLKDTFYDGKLVSFKGVEPLASVVHVDLPIVEENFVTENISNETCAAEQLLESTELQCKETFEKISMIETCFARQEQLELQDLSNRVEEKQDLHDISMKSFLSGPNSVSAQISLHRSNWDLNVTMDTWEEFSNDSAAKNDDFDGPDFCSSRGTVTLPNLMCAGTTSKKYNASLPVVGEHLISDPFLSLHTPLNCGPSFCKSETEACLDLRLEPSFIPETYRNPFNLKKVDVLKEMKFLNLSMTPTSSTREPFFLGCAAMEPKLHGCIQHVEKKTEYSWSETFVLKPVKSESQEIKESSRLTFSSAANYASDVVIKAEPVDYQGHPQDSAKGTGDSHLSGYSQNLFQVPKIPMEAVGSHIMSSNTKYDPFIKDIVLQTPRNYPKTPKYEMEGMTQVNWATEIFRRNKRCHSAISTVSSTPQPEIGTVVQPLVHEGREHISLKEAADEGSEHAGFFIKCQFEEGQNMKLLSESCDQDENTAVGLWHKSHNENAEVLSRSSLSETDTKAGPGIETHLNFDDLILQTPREHPGMLKYEVDSMAQVKQATEVFTNNKRCHIATSAVASIPQPAIGFAMQPSVGGAGEFPSIKEASNEGSEHAGFFIKYRLEEGQNMKLLSASCEQGDIVVDFLQESSDEKAEVSSLISEADTKSRPDIEAHLNCDVRESNQANIDLLCMMEEQGENECKPGISHIIDGVMPALLEKSEVDSYNYEDGELRDGTSFSANGDSYLATEIDKTEDINVPVVMSSAHEHVKHVTTECPEIYADPGTVECINNVDLAIATDLQESSSFTGDSSGKKIRSTQKISQDSLMKDEVFERKTKFDSDPTIDNKGEGSGVMENSGLSVKSSFPLFGEPKRDALDRGCDGRVNRFGTALSRSMKHIYERPLSCRVWRENCAYKSLKWERCPSVSSRDDIPIERSHKSEDETQRGWACGKRGSGSVYMRARGGSDSPHSRIRDEPKTNQFGERNSSLNYMRKHHDDFRHSRPIPSADVSVNSISDVCVPFAGRISRKVANNFQRGAHMLSPENSPRDLEQMPDMHHSSSEISPSRYMQRTNAPDLAYVSQEKNCRSMPGRMLGRGRPYGQFERTGRIAIHRERLSLSPAHRRDPPGFSPAICSPRSQARSPSHWSRHTTTEGVDRQSEMLQYRSGAPIATHESMRSTRQCVAGEILERRRGFGNETNLPDGATEVASSREYDFPRSGRDFLPVVQQRQFPGEYYGSSFARSQIHEHTADSECGIRRYNENYRRCFAGDGGEDCSFRGEEGPPRSFRYPADGNHGFHEGGSSRVGEGRFKTRLGNTYRRYRHIEQQQQLQQQQQQQQQQHEDGFRHQEEQGWNDSGFNNGRPSSRRY